MKKPEDSASLQQENNFNSWLNTFISEKGISELVLEFEDDRQWNYFPIQVLQEYLNLCSEEIQNKVKTKLVKLDFYNQNVKDFFEYIAKWIAKEI